MLPSLANLRCDTETPVRRREGPDVETNSPKRARKERKTPILVNGEWVRHYRHAPLDDESIRVAVEALMDTQQRAPEMQWEAAAVAAVYGPLAEWDTSEVQNFTRLFSGMDFSRLFDMENFTADLSGWDVGNVGHMDGMFQGARSFTSDLSRWDVGKVRDMGGMFSYATSFTSDLSKWNVGNVENMERMFSGAESFTSDLSRWDVGNVKRMSQTFSGAESFTSDLSRWNVGNVEDMSYMFLRATSFTSDLSRWDVGKVERMNATFLGAERFMSDLSKWNVGNVKFMERMFDDALSFGPPLDSSYGSGWTPESLAKHVAFVESSPVLKTYRARRRWREVRELWYVARSVVRALLVWTEERLVDEKRYDAKNPAMRKQLEDELEGFLEDLGRSEEFAARARRLCEILLHIW